MKSHWDREGDFERVVGRGKDEEILNWSSLIIREALIFPACQLGCEEMENLKGNLRGNNSETLPKAQRT